MTDIKQHIIPLGPVLVIMVGPEGAGKHAMAMDKFSHREVIDPVTIRTNLLDEQIRYDKDQLLVDEIDHMVESRLRAGGRVVVCGNNLKATRRLALSTIGRKYHAKIIYVVNDIEMSIKLHKGRMSPYSRDLDMVRITHDIFQRYESTIMSGDRDGSIEVIDCRNSEFYVVKPLSRIGAIYDIDQRGYRKVRVIPDVHGNLEGLISVLGTVSPDMFLVFLGDITDYGKGSWQCVSLIHELIVTGRAIMVRGNHDRKMARFVEQRLCGEVFSGNISHGMQTTVDQWDNQSLKNQIHNGNKFLSLVDHSPDWVQVGNWIFAHAAISPSMIDNPQFRATKNSAEEKMALYGETDGTVDADGKPHRTYRWVDEIPHGQNVMVGHQIMSVVYPTIRDIHEDNKVVFLDTGSSKYVGKDSGMLSYCDLTVVSNDEFVDWDMILQIEGFGHE